MVAQLVKVRLARKSICPCGEGVLQDHIQVGTIYTLDLDSVGTGFTYACGKCRRIITGVRCVMASQQENPYGGRRYLPYDLFVKPGETEVKPIV